MTTKKSYFRKPLALLVLAALGASMMILLASPAWAAAITVNSLADDADGLDGECTLREAITAANTDTASGTATGECAPGSGDDEIQFALPGTAPWTVNLTGALPELSSNLQIEGPGADQLTVRRSTGGDYRIFAVRSGVVSISGITITNGNVPGDFGGGIRTFINGTLTITNSTISGNSASFGGGIFNNGTLTITSSTVSGNSASGGGGGVNSDTDLSGRTTTITNSTISGNTASVRGGGVFNFDGLTVIEHSTITLNTAPSGFGSGVASFGDTSTSTEVLSTIVSANTNTDVDFVTGSTNSFLSEGYNLIGDGNATAAFNQTGDQTAVTDPGLDPLDSYGGPTQTHRLQSDSPAIDKGKSSGATTDQRGEPRPHDFPNIANATGGDGSDIGAFEVQPASNEAPTVTVAQGGACSAANDRRGTINLALSDPDTQAQDLTLSATSSDESVVPNGNIVFGGGTDASRTLRVTAIKGSDTSTLTVTVSDEDLEGTVEVLVVVGIDAKETLTGSASSDMIFAQDGQDTASGQEANDLLCGANGKDKLTGGLGADHFGGGSGTDTATDFNAAEGDTRSSIP